VVAAIAAVAIAEPIVAASADEAREAIKRWRRRGVEVILLAGGSHAEVRPLEQRLEFRGPTITELGGVIHGGNDRAILKQSPIPREVALALLRRLGEWERSEGVSVRAIAATGEVVRAGTPMVRIEATGEAGVIDALDEALADPAQRDVEATILRTAPTHLSFLAAGVDPTSSLQRVVRGLGLLPSKVIALSGAAEHAGLLAWSRGVAVGTSDAAILRAAGGRRLAIDDWAGFDRLVETLAPTPKA